MTLDINFLKKILLYNFETGIFTWLTPLAKQIKIGQQAGTRLKAGYRHIIIKGKIIRINVFIYCKNR